MNTSRVMVIVGLVGALAVSGYGSQVTAQGSLTIGGPRANFGKRALRSGFVPDPVRIRVVSGGNIDVRGLNLGAGCVGFVTQRPDFILNLRSPSSMLRFYVVAPTGDTTLVINGADGQWHCNDDSNGGRNPMVDLAGAGAGQYDVWIGSYATGTTVPGQLHITELSSNHP